MIEHLLTIYKTTDVASVDPAFVLTPDTPQEGMKNTIYWSKWHQQYQEACDGFSTILSNMNRLDEIFTQ